MVLLTLYVIFGPLAWVSMFAGFFLASSRMNRLNKRLPLPQTPPAVTILIPAKDEGPSIAKCLAAVLAQDYPNFDVLAVNDRSKDDTCAILDRLAIENPRLHVHHIPDGGLPAGWLGKCHALHAVAAKATGEWLLFVDSDVTLEPQALSTALACAIDRRYDALSILTRLECHTFWERLLLPIAAASWTVMHWVSLTNEDDRTDIAVANGQFFLIRRSTYEAVGGHASVRDQITEDVELMRRLKSAGNRVRLFFGAHLAETRMHATLRQMYHGWGRIYSGTSRRRMKNILLAILFFLVSGLSVYPALIVGAWDHRWLLAASSHFVLMTAYLMLVYRFSRNPRWNALLFPLAAGVMLTIFVYALRMCRTGRVTWRDTQYAAWQPTK